MALIPVIRVPALGPRGLNNWWSQIAGHLLFPFHFVQVNRVEAPIWLQVRKLGSWNVFVFSVNALELATLGSSAGVFEFAVNNYSRSMGVLLRHVTVIQVDILF